MSAKHSLMTLEEDGSKIKAEFPSLTKDNFGDCRTKESNQRLKVVSEVSNKKEYRDYKIKELSRVTEDLQRVSVRRTPVSRQRLPPV